VVGPIIKQRHRTARLAWARVHRRWRLHTWQLILFSDEFRLDGEHVYRVHLINVQLVTDPVIMPVKEEHGWDSGSESLDKQEPRGILHCHVER
jgi:hypothetical protein